MSREHPILFSGPMVRAIIEGRKTQTRRVVHERPPAQIRFVGWPCDADKAWKDPHRKCAVAPGPGEFHTHDVNGFHHMNRRCPYGAPGDRLWVRESFCPVQLDPEERTDEDDDGVRVEYRADTKASHPGGWGDEPDHEDALRWKPSIYMPRWASRLTLLVAAVRVERLHDITEADAKAEGMDLTLGRINAVANHETEPGTHVDVFRRGWDTINGKRAPWNSNPWVWVVTFERVP